MRWICFAALVLAGCGRSPVPAPQPPVPAPTPVPQPVPVPTPSFAQQVLDAHNRERQAKGLPALRLSSALCKAAQQHADHMATLGVMAHEWIGDGSPWDRMSAAGYQWTSAGENVAEGQPDIPAVMSAWMGSSGHRANILGKSKDAGFGMAKGKSGQPFWCSDFGSTGYQASTRLIERSPAGSGWLVPAYHHD